MDEAIEEIENQLQDYTEKNVEIQKEINKYDREIRDTTKSERERKQATGRKLIKEREQADNDKNIQLLEQQRAKLDGWDTYKQTIKLQMQVTKMMSSEMKKMGVEKVGKTIEDWQDAMKEYIAIKDTLHKGVYDGQFSEKDIDAEFESIVNENALEKSLTIKRKPVEEEEVQIPKQALKSMKVGDEEKMKKERGKEGFEKVKVKL